MSWLTVSTFITYMLTQTIIMLNFLISIMGDTFDRVKDDEESQLSIGRADFIDACEASLSKEQRKNIKLAFLRLCCLCDGVYQQRHDWQIFDRFGRAKRYHGKRRDF